MKDNPCNICEHKNKCLTLDCVFSTLTHTGSSQCCNYDCMNNTEFGCIFSFEEKCAASTCYVDDEDDMEKHGKWVEESRKADGIFDLYQTFIICSICGNEHYYDTGDKPNFCDNCGAKMDLEE